MEKNMIINGQLQVSHAEFVKIVPLLMAKGWLVGDQENSFYPQTRIGLFSDGDLWAFQFVDSNIHTDIEFLKFLSSMNKGGVLKVFYHDKANTPHFVILEAEQTINLSNEAIFKKYNIPYIYDNLDIVRDQFLNDDSV